MMHAKRTLAAFGVLLLGAAAACGAADGSFLGPNGSASNTDAGTSPSGADQGVASPVIATGIVLVHAATFPSFRLCFENMGSRVPQPETTLMPESNLVGVESGSFVRLDPMAAPGKIYVIDERVVRGSTETCDTLIGGNRLRPGNDYDVAPAITTPLGQGHVDVVALAGCGNAVTLGGMGASPSACGDDYMADAGNLRAHVIPLQAAIPTTTGKLPVQLYQLSPAVAATRDDLRVTFGLLADGGADQDVPTAALFQPGAQTTLTLGDASESAYAAYGFRIRLGGLTFDQSLASVQDLSASKGLPTTYYTAASNYALLLLGDPSVAADAAAVNPYSGVHLLAVPVIDPNKDAGADSGADAGTN